MGSRWLPPARGSQRWRVSRLGRDQSPGTLLPGPPSAPLCPTPTVPSGPLPSSWHHPLSPGSMPGVPAHALPHRQETPGPASGAEPVPRGLRAGRRPPGADAARPPAEPQGPRPPADQQGAPDAGGRREPVQVRTPRASGGRACPGQCLLSWPSLPEPGLPGVPAALWAPRCGTEVNPPPWEVGSECRQRARPAAGGGRGGGRALEAVGQPGPAQASGDWERGPPRGPGPHCRPGVGSGAGAGEAAACPRPVAHPQGWPSLRPAFPEPPATPASERPWPWS